MRDVLDDLLHSRRSGRPAALATVIRTWHSTPRPAGASMVVDPDDRVVGSVSGGCVEGALYTEALAVRDGAPPAVHRYGVSDDEALGVGLTCGGILDVFVQRVDRSTWPELEEIAQDVREGLPLRETSGPLH